jgi:hypothetical protein
VWGSNIVWGSTITSSEEDTGPAFGASVLARS